MADIDYAKELGRAKMVGAIRAKGEFNWPTKKPTQRKH